MAWIFQRMVIIPHWATIGVIMHENQVCCPVGVTIPVNELSYYPVRYETADWLSFRFRRYVCHMSDISGIQKPVRKPRPPLRGRVKQPKDCDLMHF
jgi:hypothetical protein